MGKMHGKMYQNNQMYGKLPKKNMGIICIIKLKKSGDNYKHRYYIFMALG